MGKQRGLGWSRDPGYPDDISGSDYCLIEGCIGRGPCPRCGETNYALMGFFGAVARWAKVWGISEDEAERRIGERQKALAEAELAKYERHVGRPEEEARDG